MRSPDCTGRCDFVNAHFVNVPSNLRCRRAAVLARALSTNSNIAISICQTMSTLRYSLSLQELSAALMAAQAQFETTTRTDNGVTS